MLQLDCIKQVIVPIVTRNRHLAALRVLDKFGFSGRGHRDERVRIEKKILVAKNSHEKFFCVNPLNLLNPSSHSITGKRGNVRG